MTPRSKHYFARKAFIRLIHRSMFIAQEMVRLATPIPKYPPGTSHPGGPAFVGGDPGPELILRPGQIAVTIAPKEPVMILPGTKVIPCGWNTPHPLLEKPVADMTKEMNRRILADMIGKATRPIVTDAPFEFIPLSKLQP